MSGGLGAKQIAILEMLQTNKYITTSSIKRIYGYHSSALSALSGLEARKLIKFAGNGKWVKGPEYNNAMQEEGQ